MTDPTQSATPVRDALKALRDRYGKLPELATIEAGCRELWRERRRADDEADDLRDKIADLRGDISGAEYDARQEALGEVTELLGDVDRGLLTIAEARERIEALAR